MDEICKSVLQPFFPYGLFPLGLHFHLNEVKKCKIIQCNLFFWNNLFILFFARTLSFILSRIWFILGIFFLNKRSNNNFETHLNNRWHFFWYFSFLRVLCSKLRNEYERKQLLNLSYSWCQSSPLNSKSK